MAYSSTYKSQFKAIVFDRKTWEKWMRSSNGKNLTEMTYEKARNILKNHKPVPLLEGAQKTFKELVKEFETITG